MGLTPEDKTRIEKQAGWFEDTHPYDALHEAYYEGAEYATIYEREQQQDRTNYYEDKIEMLNRTAAEQQKYVEAERSELIEKMTELLKAFNDSDKNYADWVATKELYSAFTGVNNLLERLNSLKTK